MPFKEGLFWVGITLLGAGLVPLVEGGNVTTFAVVLMIVGSLATIYSIVGHHYPSLKITFPLWIPLLVLTWIFIGYDAYGRNIDPEIPEFDEGKPGYGFFKGYGHTNDKCYATVFGDQLLRYKGKFKIALACFFSDGTSGIIDTPNIQVGSEYDITRGDIYVSVNVSPTLRPLPLIGENYVLLLIPPDVTIAQFSTLRQARALGVKIKLLGSQGGP